MKHTENEQEQEQEQEHGIHNEFTLRMNEVFHESQ